jgi:hypothetical protein
MDKSEWWEIKFILSWWKMNNNGWTYPNVGSQKENFPTKA